MEDVTRVILDYLDLKSIAACRQVSKGLKFIVDTNRSLWIRELRKLRYMNIYGYKNLLLRDVTEVFHDWEDVFDYFEKEADTDKLREFVCALQSPYDYLLNAATREDHEEMSPLHVEAFRGRHKLIHILLDSPVDFNSKTSEGHNLLHIACDNGDIELVKILLSAKHKEIDVNFQSYTLFEETPLHLACKAIATVNQYDESVEINHLELSSGLTFSKTEVLKYFLQNSEEFGIDLYKCDREQRQYWFLLPHLPFNELVERVTECNIDLEDLCGDYWSWTLQDDYLSKDEEILAPFIIKATNAMRVLKNCLENYTDAEETVRKVAKEFKIDMSKYSRTSEGAKKRKL